MGSASKHWLKSRKTEKKFVVTSVPFVAQHRTSSDKWSYYQAQQEEIIEFLFSNDIKRLVFLCADQHDSHYATLKLTAGNKTRYLHELMSSPINQVQKLRYSDYRSPYTATTSNSVKYTSQLQRSNFYNEHSNAIVASVQGNQVKYRIFRTKKREDGTAKKSFAI